ncbi:glycosyltransferase [Podospora aff. communis PSN243]|uniref:Glycosyltransferase n=1 Tax=Podospora aff. communis PSN243 TaxID=3040156 RepID=A0AAV9GV38_9PEZI|nr:glycosyltransferase [Podospora aff. communis PSN243]
MILRHIRLFIAVGVVWFIVYSFRQSHPSTLRTTQPQDVCAAHRWKPFKQSPSTPPRKVYTLLMVNTELDMLEVHLNTTYHAVDHFVLVEGAQTFTGHPKPLHLKPSLSSLSSYAPKIIYHEITYPLSFRPKTPWNIEDFQRNALLTQALTGPSTPNPNDVLIVADIDEIPRPSTISLLRACAFPRRTTLFSKFYYYSFQHRHVGPEWPHPQATTYHGRATILPNDLRTNTGFFLTAWLQRGGIANAAWHCSSCFGTIEEFLTKMRSFSHVWMNGEVYRDRRRIVERVGQGKDLWDREGEVFEKVEGNEDVPGFLREGEEGRRRFGYMVERDEKGAGFKDWEGE